LRKPLPESPVVLDIGGNAGFFCLYVASMRPGAKIVSCEPIPANFTQLSRNTSINPSLDIAALPVAVYGRTGRIKLLVESENALTTAATVFSIDGRIPIEVPCISLQDLLEKHGLDRIDLLKLDCEGSEYSILYRCPEEYFGRIEQMAVEVHDGAEPDHNMPALASFLRGRGFEIHTAGYMLWAQRKRIERTSPGEKM
jgi:FkbM family methyltransferase